MQGLTTSVKASSHFASCFVLVEGTCPYEANGLEDCGYDGISADECNSLGCCFNATSPAKSCYPAGPVLCAAGSYQTAQATSTCLHCSPGKYSAASTILALVFDSDTAPKFASSWTSMSPSGSVTLPTYDANGGPQGKGHITFDRSQNQFLDAGPQIMKMKSQGLTIIAVLQFTALQVYERVVSLGEHQEADCVQIFLFEGNTVSFLHRPGDTNENNECLLVSTDAIQQDVWIQVVARYNPEDRTMELRVDNQAVVSMSCAGVDINVSNTWAGGLIRDGVRLDRHFNGNMAGLIVIDEYVDIEQANSIINMIKTRQGKNMLSRLAYPTGTFSISSGATYCVDCPSGSFSPSGSDNESDCSISPTTSTTSSSTTSATPTTST